MPANTAPRALTPQDKKSLSDFVRSVVQTTFEQSKDYTSDFPGFIADPAPATGPFGVAKAIAQQSCRRWARGEGIPSLPGFDAAYGGICSPYLDGLGENPGDGDLDPPYVGGQCPKLYRVNGEWRTNSFLNCSTGFSSNEPSAWQSFSTEFNKQGPLGGVTITRFNPTSCGGFDGFTAFIGTPNGPTSIFQRPGTGLVRREVSVRITSVQPASGPDDCGNPESEYDPPGIPPGLPPLAPITVDIPGIGPVDVDVTFDPDGNINVELPDLGIDLTIPNPFAGDDGDPGGGTPGDATDPGSPASPSDSGSGGEAEGEAGEGEELVGVLVDVIGTPENPNEFSNVAAQVFRGVGYVRMGFPGRLGTDVSGGAVLSPQFFHAQQRGLTNWAVRANLGYNLRVTPYYRTIAQ